MGGVKLKTPCCLWALLQETHESMFGVPVRVTLSSDLDNVQVTVQCKAVWPVDHSRE